MIFPFLKQEDSAKYTYTFICFLVLTICIYYIVHLNSILLFVTFHGIISFKYKYYFKIRWQYFLLHICMYMERKMLAFFSLENFPNRSNIVDLTPTHTSPYCNNNLLHCWFIITELVRLLVLFFGFQIFREIIFTKNFVKMISRNFIDSKISQFLSSKN